MVMNSIAYKDDLPGFQKQVDIIKSYNNHYHTQREDALWKWATILRDLELLKFKNVLDVGAGDSHMALIVRDLYDVDVSVIDREFLPEICKNKGRISCIKGDFFTHPFTKTFDVILDCCSVTHFKTNGEFNMYESGKRVYELLNNGGYYLVSSDVCFGKQRGEFIDHNLMVEIYESCGFYLQSNTVIKNSGTEPITVAVELNGEKMTLNVVHLVFRKP